MLFSANFFTNEVTNAKAVIKFGTEANKKIQPKVVAHVSFAQQKSAFRIPLIARSPSVVVKKLPEKLN